MELKENEPSKQTVLKEKVINLQKKLSPAKSLHIFHPKGKEMTEAEKEFEIKQIHQQKKRDPVSFESIKASAAGPQVQDTDVGRSFLVEKMVQRYLFQKSNSKKLSTSTIITCLVHFPLDYECEALYIFSTSRSENEFTIINSQNTNHSPENVITSVLYCTRNRWTNKMLRSKARGRAKNVFKVWEKVHVWKQKRIHLDDEGQALLKNLKRFHYKQDEHYFIENDMLIICEAPKLGHNN